ncbi:hypothetical protein J3R30DRAFT_3699258 [Lentinula aciculospora]|uniref:Uncharacterized protein n=1 Tax=Lentinula aciculospora TaxID=153920 RepID=A0A9W9AHI9_9AGAR|nr:hypothetical protein J3R30DRAFT_3699258 [Lentinula aciculospora]
MSNYAYSNLLQHLHRAQPALPLETIQSALAFHIANQNSLPTPIAATAITSPLFLSHPFTLSRLQILSNSFRHSLHLKYTLLSGPRFSFFERSISTRLTEWTKALIKGLQGGNPILKLAAASGVLLGLEDLRTHSKSNSLHTDLNSNAVSQDLVSDAIRAKVEDEVVIALAEVMDQEGVGRDWEREFQQTALLSNSVQDHIPSPTISLLTLSLIFAAQSLPLVASSKLKALPLIALSRLLTVCIAETFSAGDFLRQSAISDTLRPHIASLSRLEALVLSLALNSRPREGLNSAQETLFRLHEMAVQVAGVLPQLILVDTAPTSTLESPGPWLTLKTFLFSIVMISNSVLSACIYIPPTAYRLSPTSSLSSPTSLSFTTLLTLFHLSLLVSQFGGISSSGSTDDGSFKELRKAAYLALDILACGTVDVAERFVDELMDHRPSQLPGSQKPQTAGKTGTKHTAEDTINLAKISFALSCIEQLVPVLSVRYLQGSVWKIVEPNLTLSQISSSSAFTQQTLDQLKRETFESAHSVILAMLAASLTAHPDMTVKKSRSNNENGKFSEEEDLSLSDFCIRLVPFYSGCLIQNSALGKLSTSQLRIAYVALVRSASASVPFISDENEPSQITLAWYCVAELLAAIQNLGNDNLTQIHRLHLTLVSCVSALPLSLLSRLIEEIEGILRVDTDSKGNLNDTAGLEKQEQNRAELIQMLYRELSEVVGDREKEYLLRWYFTLAAGNSIEPSRRALL